MKESLDRLISGERTHVLVGIDVLPNNPVFLSGSFNPLHKGHEELLLAAERISGREGVLELSVTNVDKPPMTLVDVERRLLQMHGVYSVVLTCAPTFAEKAELFPGVWFALGYDTAVRLLSCDYHADVPAMLARFKALGTRFVVAGRLEGDMFKSLEHIRIPAGFDELFVPLPENIFREDLSSTELRKRNV